MTIGDPILLVCVPGTLCTGRVFEPLVRELQVRGLAVRQVSVDTSKSTTVQAAADSGLSQVDLRAGERLVIAGFSLGGWIAIQMALSDSVPVSALVLLDMNGEADPVGNGTNRRAAVERARKIGVRNFVLSELWRTYVAPARIGDTALREEVLEMAEESGVEALAHQAEIAISRRRALDDAPSINVPTLVFCGGEDRVTPVAMARAVAESIPAAQLEIVAGAGHFALLEQPATVAQALVAWMAGRGGHEN